MFSRKVWGRFARVVGRFLRSHHRWPAVGLLAGLIVLLFLGNGVNVWNTYVGRDFVTALKERKPDGFWHFGVLSAGLFVLAALVSALQRFCEERLGLVWRCWLTDQLVSKYLRDRAYLRVRGRPEVENPDERIADDAKAFTTSTLSFLVLCLNGAITVAAFAGVAWSISPWLFLGCLAYALAGSAATLVVGRRLAGYNSRQLDREADFRAALIHVRQDAPWIALTQAEGPHETRLADRLGSLSRNLRRIIGVNFKTNWFLYAYNALQALVPVLVVGPLYLRGEVEFGVVTQAVVVFAQLTGALSLIVTQFQALSSFRAVVGRLDSLSRAITPGPDLGAAGIMVEEAPDRLGADGLSLRSMDGKTLLVADLSAGVTAGRGLAVTGPNAAGRAALFMALAGLWEAGRGRVVRPPGAAAQFVPQTPYLIPGTVRDQFRAADPVGAGDDERILAALAGAGAGDVPGRVGGLDVEVDWGSVVPLADRQAVAVARVFFARPPFAVLDRIDTALGPRADGVFDRLAGLGIGWVAFADPGGPAGHPDEVLELADDGTWSLHKPGVSFKLQSFKLQGFKLQVTEFQIP